MTFKILILFNGSVLKQIIMFPELENWLFLHIALNQFYFFLSAAFYRKENISFKKLLLILSVLVLAFFTFPLQNYATNTLCNNALNPHKRNKLFTVA